MFVMKSFRYYDKAVLFLKWKLAALNLHLHKIPKFYCIETLEEIFYFQESGEGSAEYQASITDLKKMRSSTGKFPQTQVLNLPPQPLPHSGMYRAMPQPRTAQPFPGLNRSRHAFAQRSPDSLMSSPVDTPPTTPFFGGQNGPVFFG